MPLFVLLKNNFSLILIVLIPEICFPYCEYKVAVLYTIYEGVTASSALSHLTPRPARCALDAYLFLGLVINPGCLLSAIPKGALSASHRQPLAESRLGSEDGMQPTCVGASARQQAAWLFCLLAGGARISSTQFSHQKKELLSTIWCRP